jgi:hypothetical protein
MLIVGISLSAARILILTPLRRFFTEAARWDLANDS